MMADDRWLGIGCTGRCRLRTRRGTSTLTPSADRRMLFSGFLFGGCIGSCPGLSPRGGSWQLSRDAQSAFALGFWVTGRIESLPHRFTPGEYSYTPGNVDGGEHPHFCAPCSVGGSLFSPNPCALGFSSSSCASRLVCGRRRNAGCCSARQHGRP